MTAVGAAGEGGGPEEGRRTSQQRASLPKRLGYLILQTGLSAALSAVRPASPNRDFDRSVIVAKDCPSQLVVPASLEYQESRSQGVANNTERAARDTSWRKIISAAGTRLWMCEMRAEIRASGAEEKASTFHVTRTSLDSRAVSVLSTLSLGRWRALAMSVESRGIHRVQERSNVCHDWKIGVASASSAGKGTLCRHPEICVWKPERKLMMTTIISLIGAL